VTFCADRCRAVQRFPAVNHPRDPGEIVLDADTDVTGGSEQVGNLLRLVIADFECDRAARLEPRQIEGGQRPVEVIPVLAAEQRHPRLVLHLRLEGFHLTARDIGRIGDHAVQGGQYRRGERGAEERQLELSLDLDLEEDEEELDPMQIFDNGEEEDPEEYFPEADDDEAGE